VSGVADERQATEETARVRAVHAQDGLRRFYDGDGKMAASGPWLRGALEVSTGDVLMLIAERDALLVALREVLADDGNCTETAPQDASCPLAERNAHREALSNLAETLASALHHHNIGRDIRGWREVTEAFGDVKAILEDRYFGPGERRG
jgi:hypothetical protein